MPLLKSGTREAISENVRELEAAGRPLRQAQAIALSVARKAGAKIPPPHRWRDNAKIG